MLFPGEADDIVSIELVPPKSLSTCWVWRLSANNVSLTRVSVGDFSTLETDLEQRINTPWAFVAQDSDGRIVGFVSTNFQGGLFWSESKGKVLLSDDLKSVVRARRGTTDLDEEFIRGLAMRRRWMPSERTPFRQVGTFAPGTRFRWVPGSTGPECSPVAGSDSWKDPHIQGDSTIELYRSTFDSAVDSLVVPGQPISATLSGGLDSTFVVASLIRHATADNPIHAFCHSPHPQAVCATKPNWDPDDFPWAQEMVKAYPQRIVLHRIISSDGESPLDAAARQTLKSWYPTLTPANQMWLDQASQRAADQGSTRLFSGRNGNAAFSNSHEYAVGHYLRKAQFGSAWSSIHMSEPMLQPGMDKFRARAVRPLVSRLRARARRQRSPYLRLVGLGHLAPAEAPVVDRAFYLDWLAGSDQPSAGTMFSAWPAPLVDPFCDPKVLDLAASMTPLEWSRGPQPRGYARLLGQGRIPDGIRLRTRQGGQSMDQWHFMRNHRDRYYDEAWLLTKTPILGGWVDHTSLLRILDTWPWGQRQGPQLLPLVAMNSILSLGAYVRMMQQHLAHLEKEARQ